MQKYAWCTSVPVLHCINDLSILIKMERFSLFSVEPLETSGCRLQDHAAAAAHSIQDIHNQRLIMKKHITHANCCAIPNHGFFRSNVAPLEILAVAIWGHPCRDAPGARRVLTLVPIQTFSKPALNGCTLGSCNLPGSRVQENVWF